MPAWLKTISSFFSSAFSAVFAQWQFIVGALMVGLLIGGAGTWRVMSWENASHQVAQTKVTTRVVIGQSKINIQLGEIVFPRIEAAEGHTATVQQEIPQHVTPEIDAAHSVPLGFVRVFNDASHGPIPGPAAGGDADPSGVPLSDVAQAHAADEGTLDQCRIENDAWWAWYDQQSAIWNRAIK